MRKRALLVGLTLTAVLVAAWHVDRVGVASAPLDWSAPTAIVVLGARVEEGGTASPTLRARVAHAVEVARTGAPALFIVSGGLGDHGARGGKPLDAAERGVHCAVAASARRRAGRVGLRPLAPAASAAGVRAPGPAGADEPCAEGAASPCLAPPRLVDVARGVGVGEVRDERVTPPTRHPIRAFSGGAGSGQNCRSAPGWRGLARWYCTYAERVVVRQGHPLGPAA
jgi:hypothetical protein